MADVSNPNMPVRYIQLFPFSQLVMGPSGRAVRRRKNNIRLAGPPLTLKHPRTLQVSASVAEDRMPNTWRMAFKLKLTNSRVPVEQEIKEYKEAAERRIRRGL